MIQTSTAYFGSSLLAKGDDTLDFGWTTICKLKHEDIYFI